MNNKKIMVLHILPALNFCGGIENYVMNYYRNIDRNRIQFDFITHTEIENSFKNEIYHLDGNVYEFAPFSIKNIKKILNEIDEFIFINRFKYDIIHCHMANAACFYFYYVNKYNKNIIKILHSHQPAYADKKVHSIRNYFLIKLGNLLADSRLACSMEAGKFLFKNKPFKIIKNAIDAELFKSSHKYKKVLQKSLNLKNKFVIGHIGRFSPVKNHEFLLDVLEESLKINKNSVLVLIGDGEDKEKYISKVIDKKLEKSVLFFKTCKDIFKYYSIFDIFLLPSFYEGIGMVAIEAQYAGVPVLASKNRVPKETQISNKIKFLPLELGAKKWCDEINYICKLNEDINIFNYDYDISVQAKTLENYYMEIISNECK